MFKPKTKGLFIDISEFSILAVRTSGYELPIVVEEIAEYPIVGNFRADDARAFLEQIVDFKGADYYVSRCGVYPSGRFVRRYQVESMNKVKSPGFLEEVLRSEFKIDPELNRVSILDARDGADFDLERGLTKELFLCGAPLSACQEMQDQLLSAGLYPDRMEVSTITSLGGICDYAQFNHIDAPILCIELTSQMATVFIINNGRVEVARPVPVGLDSIYPLLQRELGLKDESSARKLFYSNTFDFAEMGPKLLRRMVKELQATSGFYEVQTGLTIERVFLGVLPKNLKWIAKTVSDSLGIEVLQLDLEPWLGSLNIQLGPGVEVSNLGSRWLGVFSLMGEFQSREEVAG
jgi:hypothetical protein